MTESYCDYCGAQACAWQGSAAWCSSPACSQRHADSIWVPSFDLPIAPLTLWEILGAWLMCLAFACVCRSTPVRWILLDAGSLKHKVSAWAWGNAYYWDARRDGWA